MQTESKLVHCDKKFTPLFADCHEVLELHAKFLSLIDKKLLQVEIFSFIETVQTFMTLLFIQIVSIESAGEFS
jgi:hypothetical protein